jgi:hypothetical protein
MKRCSLFILFLAICNTLFAQVPRFAKYQIEDTGAFFYAPDEPDFELSYSEDSSKVFTTDILVDSFYFSAIIIEFSESLGTDKEANETLMMSYLDYLKVQLNITEAAGYGRGHTLESNEGAVGVIDYWADADKVQYQLKGWVNSEMMAILIIYGDTEYPNFTVTQMYLNGFRFPE